MNYCILLHIDRESHFVILSFLHILVLIFVLLGFFSFLFFCLFDFFLAWLIPRVRFTKPIFPIISLGFLSVSFCSPFQFFQSFLLRFSFSSLRSVLTFHSSLSPDFFLFIYLSIYSFHIPRSSSACSFWLGSSVPSLPFPSGRGLVYLWC